MSDRTNGPGVWLQLNLLSQIAFAILVMALALPSMPDWIDEFGESQSRVNLTFSAYLIAFALFPLIYGPASDRLGRRPVLIFGLLLVALGSLLGYVASDLNQIIAARGLQGAGAGAGVTVCRAMIQDYFAGTARTQMMAYMGMVMGLCPPGGTLIGGYLHVALGWQAGFAFAGLISLALLLAAVTGFGSSDRQTTRKTNHLPVHHAYRQLFQTRDFMAYCIVAATASGSFYVFLSAAPIVLDAYGVAADGIGWYILMVPASYITGNLITSRLVSRVSDYRLLWAGQGLTVLGLLLVVLLSVAGIHQPLAISAPLMLLGAGHGLLMPGVLAGAVGALPALAGSASAIAGMMQQLIGAGGSTIAGYLNLTNATAMTLVMLALTLIGVAAQTRLSFGSGPDQ